MINGFLNSLKNGDRWAIAPIPAIDSVTRGWLVIFLGTGARLGLNFLTGVLIARTFGPANFGVYSLLTAVVGITGVITDFGLTEAAVKNIAANWSEERRKALTQAQVYFWLRISLAGIGVVAGAVAARSISQHLVRLPDDSTLVFLALLGMGATALSGSVNALFQGSRQFGKISVVLVTSSGFGLLVAIFLALVGQLTLVTAMLGVVTGTALAGFLVGYRLLPEDWGASDSPLRYPGWKALKLEGPKLFRFGRWLWLANIFRVLMTYLDFFLLNIWLAPVTVGAYALALGLASRIDIVNQSLYTVLVPTASALKSRRDVLEYLRRGFIRSALVSLVLLILFPVASWFIPFFYGQDFLTSVDLFRLLLAVTIFDIIFLPTLLLIYTFDRPELATLAEAIRVVTLISVGVWLIPTLGPVGAVAAKLSAKIIGVVVTLAVLALHYRNRRGAYYLR